MALGATRREVSRMVVRRVLAHTGVGVTLGAGRGGGDWRRASLLPARLAASIAPIDALRER